VTSWVIDACGERGVRGGSGTPGLERWCAPAAEGERGDRHPRSGVVASSRNLSSPSLGSASRRATAMGIGLPDCACSGCRMPMAANDGNVARRRETAAPRGDGTSLRSFDLPTQADTGTEGDISHATSCEARLPNPAEGESGVS
jgi:hypothetical protein